MATWGVNHGTLNIGWRQTIKVCVCVQRREILEKGFEVLVGVVNVLQAHPDNV